ncbi:MAG: hypothetical protein M3R15_16960 [Acidobacteriota bacterium]|nr:hypothetical protein [Acidobacteriota bacterium]
MAGSISHVARAGFLSCASIPSGVDLMGSESSLARGREGTSVETERGRDVPLQNADQPRWCEQGGWSGATTSFATLHWGDLYGRHGSSRCNRPRAWIRLQLVMLEAKIQRARF